MPTPSKGPRLGGSPAHERLMLSNLATALFEHGRITTTHAKARRLRPLAEKLITSAKRGDLHARRRVLTVVRDKGVVHTLFTDIGPRFAERPGGYTRITKLGPRKGDNAPMAMIELVEGRTVAQQAVGEAERARGSRFRLPSRRSAGSAVTGVPAAGSVATAVPTEGDIEGAPESGEQPAPLPAEGDVEGGFEPADPEAVGPDAGDIDEPVEPADPEAVGPDAGDIDEPAVPEPAAGAEPTSSAGTEPDPEVDDETTDEANRGEPT